MAKIGVDLLLYAASFTEKDLPLIRKVASFGFDGVEIPLFDPASTPVARAKAVMDEEGLSGLCCAIIGPDRDLISEDAAVRKNAKQYIRDCLEIASEWKSPVFCGPIYSAVGKLVGRSRTEQEWAWAVEGLRELGPFAADQGVTLALEPLNRFETYFINIAEDVRRLVDEVDHPNVGIHLDTFHMNIEEKSLYQAIKTSGDRLVHVHCCENDRGTPGTGHVDWDGVFKGLDEIGYDNWLVIESFVPGVKEIAKAAAIWRPLAASADAIAIEGLKFLRERRPQSSGQQDKEHR